MSSSPTQKPMPKSQEANGSNRMDIIIRNATIVTLDKTRRIINDGSIGIKNGKIDWIDDARQAVERVAVLDIDARNRIVMPGLVNPHCHVAHSMARGCGDDLHFLKWLPVVYSIEDAYTDEEWYLTSLLTMIEMIKSGTTCFADTNVFEEFDWVARAAVESGIRADLGKNIRDSGAPEQERAPWLKEIYKRDSSAPRNLSLEAALESHAKWNGAAGGRIKVRLSPSVWPVCSTKTFQQIADVGRQKGIGKLIHHTEAQEWKQFVCEVYGKEPTFMLQDFGILGADTLLENATWLDDDEIALIAKSGTRFNYLPTSNLKANLGALDLRKFIGRGVIVSIGTAGGLINNVNDVFSEMKILALKQRMLEKRPDGMPLETIVEIATLGGAQCLNLEKEIGSLEVGKKADVIVIDADQPHMVPVINPLSAIVYGARGGDVETTIIDGRAVMLNRRMQTVNEAQVLEAVRQAVPSLLKRSRLEGQAHILPKWACSHVH
jgi:cytosine/adenosine deaminase-related metal-dependent hydrolase